MGRIGGSTGMRTRRGAGVTKKTSDPVLMTLKKKLGKWKGQRHQLNKIAAKNHANVDMTPRLVKTK